MMKRRNNAPNDPKLRQRIKKSKMADGVLNWAPMIYVKLVAAWAALMGLDYIFGFRLEYLWPTWLLVRSIYDSFRYQGIGFSIFFVCVTLTSDLVCFLFIPVQWLFLLASTYVWLQYVWHADRGICLPTVCLCLLFVYVEASVRLKEILHTRGSLPFTLDLCRPFAAHCIGYPVVTLGFGIKSYVGYKYRLRRQREIAKENEVYSRILTEALPGDWNPNRVISNGDTAHDTYSEEAVISNGGEQMNGDLYGKLWPHGVKAASGQLFGAALKRLFSTKDNSCKYSNEYESDYDDDDDAESSRGSTAGGLSTGHHQSSSSALPNKNKNAKAKKDKKPQAKMSKDNSAVPPHVATPTNNNNTKEELYHQVDKGDATKEEQDIPLTQNSKTTTDIPTCNANGGKCDRTMALERELDSAKKELRQSRLCESDLRSQVKHLTNAEKAACTEATQWHNKYDQIDTKLSNERRAREQDKQSIQTLEKKLVEEQRVRKGAEMNLEKERKQQATIKEHELKSKLDDKRIEQCGEQCQKRRDKMESEIRQLKHDIKTRDAQIMQRDHELGQLRQYRDAHNSEVLMSALSTMREKNTQLEKSLSAENRLKQDLFSALGEAKHQIDTFKSELKRKDDELSAYKLKNVTQGEAITPPPPAPTQNNNNSMVVAPSVSLTSGSGSGNAFGSITQYHHLNNGHSLNFGHFGTSMATTDDRTITDELYSGISAYLSSTGNHLPTVSTPATLDGDRFEDALTTPTTMHSSNSYTPPRSH